MLLSNKNAVIYGAGGGIGGAVAHAFAREGAYVFLTGTDLTKLESIAREIKAAGGKAEAAQVDALNESAIDKHLNEVITKAGSIDISFNAVGFPNAAIGVLLTDIEATQFSKTVTDYATSYFLTARQAA